MDMTWLLDAIGEDKAAALAGLIVGMVFGIAAQRSRFCLRAATVEFARGTIGPRTAVWLLTFATALFWTQAGVLSGVFSLDESRMLAVPGSISGAILGGLIFGAGMILARGCSGRLLVLSATGNLRAVISGLVFAVAAQMSLHGWLAPLRNRLAEVWITPGGQNIHLTTMLGLPDWSGLAVALVFTVIALFFAARNRVGTPLLFMASGVGLSIALGWFLTFSLASMSFDPVQVESATFTGPSAETLMFFLTGNAVLEFDVGLIPGVFIGAFFAALWARELKLQGFEGGASMRRYLSGAAMMGFGGMLAGGCAVGAGVTGTSALALTMWLALSAMWAGAVVTDLLLDQPKLRRSAHA